MWVNIFPGRLRRYNYFDFFHFLFHDCIINMVLDEDQIFKLTLSLTQYKQLLHGNLILVFLLILLSQLYALKLIFYVFCVFDWKYCNYLGWWLLIIININTSIYLFNYRWNNYLASYFCHEIMNYSIFFF